MKHLTLIYTKEKNRMCPLYLLLVVLLSVGVTSHVLGQVQTRWLNIGDLQHNFAASNTEPEVMKRAERTIIAYETEAIIAAEEAFIKAVNRKAERKNLPYFFGTLRRIQQERDDEAYRQYCYQRYNEEVMLRLKHQQEKAPQGPSINNILGLLVQAVRASAHFVRDLAIRKAREYTLQLMADYRYPGALKKHFSDALGNFKDLGLDQKNRIWELIEQFLGPKSTGESVT